LAWPLELLYTPVTFQSVICFYL